MKILCFGDSNTYGYDPRSYYGSRYPALSRWVDLLGEKLNSQMVNAGENGRRIPRGEELCNFYRMLASQKPIDLLIVMLGSNDLLQGNPVEIVIEQMQALLEYIPLERSEILLIGPPPMQRGEWVPTQVLIDASVSLNREYKALAERFGIRFVCAETWNVQLAFDGVHFTEEGHKAFAEGLENYLNKGE